MLNQAQLKRIVAFRRICNANFKEQLEIFAENGTTYSKLMLPNREIVVQGDCVEIDVDEDFSNTSSPGERCIAEICEIKGESNRTINKKRWVKCRWFYTNNNLQRYKVTVGNLSNCDFGNNELVLSNHEQVISAEAILCKVQVKFFNEFETDQDQEHIGRHDLWYR
ncbi:hypothetical protein FRC07_002917 [Ceratobasidium sp. 392]|nr:hypothetical protein FRC07_002917 [Ceratobasidium sp. 392]